MDRGAWRASYSSWNHKESDTTEVTEPTPFIHPPALGAGDTTVNKIDKSPLSSRSAHSRWGINPQKVSKMPRMRGGAVMGKIQERELGAPGTGQGGGAEGVS